MEFDLVDEDIKQILINLRRKSRNIKTPFLFEGQVGKR